MPWVPAPPDSLLQASSSWSGPRGTGLCTGRCFSRGSCCALGAGDQSMGRKANTWSVVSTAVWGTCTAGSRSSGKSTRMKWRMWQGSSTPIQKCRHELCIYMKLLQAVGPSSPRWVPHAVEQEKQWSLFSSRSRGLSQRWGSFNQETFFRMSCKTAERCSTKHLTTFHFKHRGHT